MATAADVPLLYDLVIGSDGFVLADNWTGGDTSNAPQKAIHAFSPAFVQRTNTQGNYGDDQQEFWLTFSQKDWSLGEKQKYAKTDENGRSRYWKGEKTDVSVPGEVSMRYDTRDLTLAANISALSPRGQAGGDTGIAATAGSNLYDWNETTNTLTSIGAHGLGAVPSAMTWDGADIYMTTTASGTVGVRKYDGSSFTTFSASGADSLAFLNNSLYGLAFSSGGPECKLVRWSSAGTRSTLFTWLMSDGGERPTSQGKILPYGGKLLILLGGSGGNIGIPELWIYDGVGVSLLHQFPRNFMAWDVATVSGTVFVAGSTVRTTADDDYLMRPVIFYYSNGQIGKLWEAEGDLALGFPGLPGLAPFGTDLLFTDDYSLTLKRYDLGTGGVTSIGTYDVLDSSGMITAVSSWGHVLFVSKDDDVYFVYPSSTKVSTSTITSSLVDFDSSLTKIFRGIKVDYDEASDGDGGSIDIAYQINGVGGAFTTLQTGAVSGTEYNLSNITGRSISVKITLNKGTSTLGPVLKRVYVRAVPLGNNFHRARYVLASWGKGGDSNVKLRNDAYDPRTGQQIAMDLMDAAESQTPLTITDKFETFTGIVEACELVEFRDREYVAQVTVRQI